MMKETNPVPRRKKSESVEEIKNQEINSKEINKNMKKTKVIFFGILIIVIVVLAVGVGFWIAGIAGGDREPRRLLAVLGGVSFHG